MKFQRIYLGCLSQASYYIADEASGRAVIVDPRRDVDVYLEAAEADGARIDAALLTHFHADFVAGHIELRERCGTKVVLGAQASPEYPARLVRDGERLDYGSFSIGVLETPGHTPESVCYLVYDHAKSRELPWAVLTGDTLFVGDVGRPDLLASVGVTAEELAGSLYDSLHDKLLSLPDETIVYPGHGAGSMCGKALGSEPSTTIGAQRKLNLALQPMSKADFVALVTAEQPAAPQYFGYDAGLNKRERGTLSPLPEGEGWSASRLWAHLQAGGKALDLRPREAFAAGHIPGSWNLTLDGRFASWAGTLLSPEDEVALIGAPEACAEAAMRLGRIGYDAVVGAYTAGLEAWDEELAPLATITRIEALSGEDGQLIDVRKEGEFGDGHIPGAVNLPLRELSLRASELDPSAPVTVYCRSGYRSAAAASILTSAGFAEVRDLGCGYVGWTGAPSCGAA